MKTYFLWYDKEEKGKGAILNVDPIIEEALSSNPKVQRVTFIMVLHDMLCADEIITVDSEEELKKVFPNAVILDKPLEGGILH